MPSKKERARQRKEAKRAAAPSESAPPTANAAAAGTVPHTADVVATAALTSYPYLGGSIIDEQRKRYFAAQMSKSKQPNDIIEQIMSGETRATEFVAYDIRGDGGDAELAFVERLCSEEVMNSILGFLSQCMRPFQELKIGQAALRDVAEDPVVDPNPWLAFLLNVTSYGSPDNAVSMRSVKRCRIQLAHEIGPLVRGMCSQERTFFADTLLWYCSVQSFLCLVHNIALTEEAQDALLSQKGLIEFVVQATFWESCRPDIVEESKVYASGRFRFHGINDVVERLVSQLIDDALSEEGCDKEHAQERLLRIGCTPILSKPHREKGRIPTTFVTGLTHLLRENQNSYANAKPYLTLHNLVQSGCVDRDVISGVMELLVGSNSYVNAAKGLFVLFDALCPDPGGRSLPNGNRFAFAIDRGLLGLCLELAVRFKGFIDPESTVVGHLHLIVCGAMSVSCQAKASKAVTRQLDNITKMVKRSNVALTKNRKEHKVLREVTMILALHNGICKYKRFTCQCCKKNLSEMKAKRCRGCMAVFCSRGCQEEYWRQGNKCCTEKVAQREAKLKQNTLAVAEKIMAEDRLNLFAQATLQNYDITDCVVVINLVQSPLVRVVLASRFIQAAGEVGVSYQLEQLIAQCRSEGSLAGVVYSVSSEMDQSGGPKTQPFFGLYPFSPTGSSTSESWEAAHGSFGKGRKKQSAIMQSGDLRARFGIFFCDWYEYIVWGIASNEFPFLS